jgi:hypothetical protein
MTMTSFLRRTLPLVESRMVSDHSRSRWRHFMPSNQSVTKLINQLKAGDPAAAQQLWERYFDRMVGLARKHLRGAPRRSGDEEDAALHAFDSFCRRAREGRFPELFDRNNLWRLLVVITARKAWKLRRQDLRLHDVPEGDLSDLDLEQFIDSEPTPQFAALVSDEYRRLIQMLDDAAPDQAATLREIALLFRPRNSFHGP